MGVGDMILDEIFAQLRAVTQAWSQQAENIRKISGVDPVAETLSYCASEMDELLRQIDAGVSLLTVHDYARAHHVTPQTIRTWIRSGELEAVRNASGLWRIRRDARRKRAS